MRIPSASAFQFSTIFLSSSVAISMYIEKIGPDPSTKEFPMTDMTVVQDKMKAIATAHTDYLKSSFEANKAYMEKIATIKAPDQAMQITTELVNASLQQIVSQTRKRTFV